MITETIRKIINKDIPNHDFEFVSESNNGDGTLLFVYESKIHPGRRLPITVPLKQGKPDVTSLIYFDPGFNESDELAKRFDEFFETFVSKDKFCLLRTGYFNDTPNTSYAERKKVYGASTFCVWVDPDVEINFNELAECAKEEGFLSLFIEYVPNDLFALIQGKYDTKESDDYRSFILDTMHKTGYTLKVKLMCFGRPAFRREETDADIEKGFAPSEIY